MNLECLLIVEDDPATRAWLSAHLQQPQREVHVCAGQGEALHWLRGHQPDVALIDLGLPDGSGIGVIADVVRRHPQCEVLVISVFGDEAHVVAAIEAGASGYLLKDRSFAQLDEHLQHLREGGSPLSPQIARTLIKRQQQRDQHGQPGVAGTAAPSAPSHGLFKARATPAEARDDQALTQREREVLGLIAKGFSYQESAELMGVSTNTLRTYIKRIYQKLAVNSRTEAIFEFNQRQAERGLPPLH